MLEDYVIERNDYHKIKKLRTLNNVNTFWDDVRKLTKNVYSKDHFLTYPLLSIVFYIIFLICRHSKNMLIN